MHKLSDKEAELMLEQLSKHFDQPVLPMRRFCGAISQWFRCIENLNQEDDGKAWKQGAEYWQHLQKIEIDIQKSNLLARLLYEGEKFRTMKCPKHNGHLTFAFDEPECACQQTGWLPAE